MDNLHFLFHMIVLSSKQLRVENKTADGLAFWKPIKKILQKHDKTTFGNWKHMSKRNYHDIMSLPEKSIDGYGKEMMNESNHFLIQTVRLPNESEHITLRKLIQVALNIGQYIGISDESHIWMHLDKYAKVESIKQMDKIVTKDLVESILTEILQFVPTMGFYIKDIKEHFE